MPCGDLCGRSSKPQKVSINISRTNNVIEERQEVMGKIRWSVLFGIGDDVV